MNTNIHVSTSTDMKYVNTNINAHTNVNTIRVSYEWEDLGIGSTVHIDEPSVAKRGRRLGMGL